MKSSRDYTVYLQDMLHAAEKACLFTQDMEPEEFLNNEEKIFAVTRALEIIGEAAKHVPETVQKKYPDIPWRTIAGTRDKLIHAYFDVHVRRLWTTVEQDLPPLKTALTRILRELKDKE
jgi:uncharacterized protein with HEPN domain